jgi:hypothetical protein
MRSLVERIRAAATFGPEDLMRENIVLASLVGVAWLGVAACGTTAAPAATDAAVAAIENGPVADSTQFQETSVWIAADGSTRVAVRTVTAGEQRARAALRERMSAGGLAPQIARDTACSQPSFWLFDRHDWTGNEICFDGPGVATLHSYGFIRPVCGPLGCYEDTWEIRSGSYWAGVAPGEIWTGPSPGSPVDGGVNYAIPFDAWAKSTFDVGASLYVDHLDLAR